MLDYFRGRKPLGSEFGAYHLEIKCSVLELGCYYNNNNPACVGFTF